MNIEIKSAEELPKQINSTDEPAKLPYQQLKLINYGKVTNITKGGGSQFTDESPSEHLF